MLVFPYKADVDLGRWPILTLAVCAVCIAVFVNQLLSEHTYAKALDNFCNYEVARDEQIILRYLDKPYKHYCEAMLDIRVAPDHKQAILQLAAASRPMPFYANPIDGRDYVYSVLSDSSRRFERAVPHNLTDDLHYDPKTLNIKRMLTAAFSHGSWSHLIFNLIFFFAFAASVEVITGYLFYLVFIAIAAIGTHFAYRYSVQGVENAPPTVGLSGVVMAMMAFLATIMPTLSIRCFFWFIWIIRTFRVPALVIAVLYIGENIYDYLNRDPNSNVNYVAHISGAGIGIVLGLIYRIRNGDYLRDVAPGV